MRRTNPPSPPCNECSAIVIFMPDWVQPLGVGAAPLVESDRSAALSEDDLRSYRMLLASSDDFKVGTPGTVRLAQAR
jgi:hypothetical protein